MRGALVCAVLAASVGVARAELAFVAPAGWRVVTRADHDGAPPDLAALALAGGAALVAFDPAPLHGPATLTALITPYPKYLDDGATRNMLDAHELAPASAFLVERKLLSLNGVRGARIVFDTGQHERISHYLIEGGRHTADLIFRCATVDYEHYAPLFRAAAFATTGAAPTAAGVPATPGTVAVAGAYRFPIPTGWIDLSPHASQDSLRFLPPWMLELRAGNNAALALDSSGNPFYPPRFIAQLTAIPLDVSESTLPAFETQLSAKDLVVFERGIVELGGRPAARFIADMPGRQPVRVLIYFVSSAHDAVALTFSCVASDFAAELPRFEATARATILPPAAAIARAGGISPLWIAGGALLVLLGLALVLSSRKARWPRPRAGLWIALAVLGAAAVAWSTQRTWMRYQDSRGHGRISVDLTGMTMCGDASCQRLGYDQIPDDGRAHWRGVARLLYWVALVTALLLLVGAVAGVADDVPALLALVWPSVLLAIATAALTLGFYLIAVHQGASAGWFDGTTLALALGGSAAGALGRLGIARQQEGGP